MRFNDEKFTEGQETEAHWPTQGGPNRYAQAGMSRQLQVSKTNSQRLKKVEIEPWSALTVAVPHM